MHDWPALVLIHYWRTLVLLHDRRTLVLFQSSFPVPSTCSNLPWPEYGEETDCAAYEPIVVLAVLDGRCTSHESQIQIVSSTNTGDRLCHLRDMTESSPRLLDRLLSSRPLCCGASVSYNGQVLDWPRGLQKKGEVSSCSSSANVSSQLS